MFKPNVQKHDAHLALRLLLTTTTCGMRLSSARGAYGMHCRRRYLCICCCQQQPGRSGKVSTPPDPSCLHPSLPQHRLTNHLGRPGRHPSVWPCCLRARCGPEVRLLSGLSSASCQPQSKASRSAASVPRKQVPQSRDKLPKIPAQAMTSEASGYDHLRRNPCLALQVLGNARIQRLKCSSCTVQQRHCTS